MPLWQQPHFSAAHQTRAATYSLHIMQSWQNQASQMATWAGSTTASLIKQANPTEQANCNSRIDSSVSKSWNTTKDTLVETGVEIISFETQATESLNDAETMLWPLRMVPNHNHSRMPSIRRKTSNLTRKARWSPRSQRHIRLGMIRLCCSKTEPIGHKFKTRWHIQKVSRPLIIVNATLRLHQQVNKST